MIRIRIMGHTSFFMFECIDSPPRFATRGQLVICFFMLRKRGVSPDILVESDKKEF
jgi:hypothetical protein